MIDKNLIKKYVLENAVRYNGKANLKSTIAQILGQQKEYRAHVKKIQEILPSLIEEINSLDQETQKQKLLELDPNALEKKEKVEKSIFNFLKIKEGTKIRSCFPPGPEKYFHIGHSKAIFLNYLLAEEYNGDFQLRFEDTNPKLVKPEFYEIMQEDIAWLGIKPSKVVYASDYIDLLKEKAIKLIKKNRAYVCFCSGEIISENRAKMISCECRENTIDLNLKYFKEMETYPEEKAVLRLRIDLSHKNSRMRDPTIFRVIDYDHPRTGPNRNYPTYDFQNAVLDGYFEITHRFRTLEFEMASELHQFIRKELDLFNTFTYEMARFNLKGMAASGRVIREKLESGELIGWDDPSLPTLRALKRRGFSPEAIKLMVIESGITKNSGAEITWDTLIKYNKRVLNNEAKRYFFIKEPVVIEVKNDPKQKYSLPLHPSQDLGSREFQSSGTYYIEKEDLESFEEGVMVRLMDNINFRFNNKEKECNFLSTDYLEFRDEAPDKKKIIHFLPKDEEQLVKVSIFTPEHDMLEGFAEKHIEDLKVGEVIQFERFGFCRLDSIEVIDQKKDLKKYNFWLTH